MLAGAGVTPSRRLDRLLARLSRDRWLKPDDAHRIAVRFAQRHSGAWAKVLNAVPQEAFHVGMIRGFPVAFAWADWETYRKVLAVVRKKRMTDEQKMIEFLKIAEEGKIT